MLIWCLSEAFWNDTFVAQSEIKAPEILKLEIYQHLEKLIGYMYCKNIRLSFF